MSEIPFSPAVVAEASTNTSIADLVAEGLPLSDVAAALQMSVVDVLRWYSEMAAVLHVHDLASLAGRLRDMTSGPVSTPDVVAPSANWDLDDITPHLTPLMSPPSSTPLAG